MSQPGETMATAATANSKSASKRDETFWAILNAAMELDFKKGHLKWTMSELSRKSGITRSLIYYHFGRSKASILEESVRVIGEEFIGMGTGRMQMWKQGDIVSSMKRTREIYNNSPFLCQFYLNHRDKPTEIGNSLRRLEQQFIRKLHKFYPRASEIDVRTLFSVFFGVSFAPMVDDAVIERLGDSIRRLTSGV